MGDELCGLECVKQGCNVHDFIGPVKIVLVDPPADQYSRRKLGAAFTAVSIMMIGANTFTMMLFFSGFKLKKMINLHIILCTFGSQFCMPLAILMINPLYGAAAPLMKPGRKLEHSLLHVVGIGCFVSGSLLAILKGEASPIARAYEKEHFYSGCAALGLAGMALFFGPCLLCVKAGFLARIHRFFGILGFATSSVCFVFGIIKPTMQVWLYIVGYKASTYLLVFFCAFYTLAVISSPLTNLFAKEDKCNQ